LVPNLIKLVPSASPDLPNQNQFGFELPSPEEVTVQLLVDDELEPPPAYQNKYFGFELLPPKDDSRALFGSTTTNPVPLPLGAHFLLRPLFRTLNGFLSFPTLLSNCWFNTTIVRYTKDSLF
jgi:hypothetical protein